VSFVHEDNDFEQLLQVVAEARRIEPALIEKDYWVTHTLWALHQSGLEIWFKGGTSLSKGFGLIERFSEDLDLMVEAGPSASLPRVASWTSTNAGPVAERRTFYAALESALVVPGVRVELDALRMDKYARSADYLARYPGTLMDQLAPTMSPFVRLEVGRARVVPCTPRAISSFVHDHLEGKRILGGYTDNRPQSVRCVHPLVTLLEKLDAMARRYVRDQVDPAAFVRHYEDAAQIIRALAALPTMDMTPEALALDMLRSKDIAALPTVDEPALVLADPTRRAAVERAYRSITPMFWGPRIPLDETCSIIRAWIGSALSS
jgi:hypothetical protein